MTMRRFLIFVASLALLPTMAHSQNRGRAGGPVSGSVSAMSAGMARPAMAHPTFARPAMAAPHFAMRAAPPTGIRSSAGLRPYSGMRYVPARSGALPARPLPPQIGSPRGPRPTRAVLSEDVPGLGFDYPHYAATHPQGTPGHDRDRNRNAQFVGAYFPFYGGGYYLPLLSDEEDLEQAPPAGMQQAEVPQAGAQQAEAEELEPEQTSDRPPAVQASQDYVPPTQDSDQYVFVRRDGTLFFVVAYAWENGTLRYITSEGIRRTVAVATLDLNATQRFNEERGLHFRKPV